MVKYQSLSWSNCAYVCGLVCVCGHAQVSVCTEVFSEQSIYSPPEGMAGREGDVRVNCVVESRRGDELSLVN